MGLIGPLPRVLPLQVQTPLWAKEHLGGCRTGFPSVFLHLQLLGEDETCSLTLFPAFFALFLSDLILWDNIAHSYGSLEGLGDANSAGRGVARNEFLLLPQTS